MSILINKYLVYAVGFIAQLLFSWRMIHQWLSSEKIQKTQVPQQFWVHSLTASFLLFVYGWLRNDFAIILGQSITYFIYIRNMQLQGTWKKLHSLLRLFLLFFPFAIVIYAFNNTQIDLHRFFKNEYIPLWLILLGSIGQVIFTFRFIYQLTYSEKRKESLLPLGFWLISLIGCLLILSYAIIRKDPVLFTGQIAGLVVYSRNIMIIRKKKPLLHG
ncbi:lipid-A-disaccharide synthase N-terminal domain-containing protein [Pedobacter sp.]|uniref:lipid-A-disaccharide synthase N-terminal domain-containing protein n=1 Tax=Pedobacter sp. TaxID=1411316 RepID=UPI003D7F76E1